MNSRTRWAGSPVGSYGIGAGKSSVSNMAMLAMIASIEKVFFIDWKDWDWRAPGNDARLICYAIAAAVAFLTVAPCGLIQTDLAGLFHPWHN